MQRQRHDEGSSTELEHYDAEDAPTRQHRGSDPDLSHYDDDDDDVATAPWPPQLS